jgi:hypothetical protein
MTLFLRIRKRWQVYTHWVYSRLWAQVTPAASAPDPEDVVDTNQPIPITGIQNQLGEPTDFQYPETLLLAPAPGLAPKLPVVTVPPIVQTCPTSPTLPIKKTSGPSRVGVPRPHIALDRRQSMRDKACNLLNADIGHFNAWRQGNEFAPLWLVGADLQDKDLRHAIWKGCVLVSR